MELAERTEVMALKVTSKETKKGAYVVALEGRLDTTTAADCDAALKPLIKNKAKSITLDLSTLSYISSMGLRVILDACKSMEEHKGRLVVTNLQAPIAKVFEMADVLPKTDIFKNVEEADQFLDALQRKEKLSHMEFPE
jgi:anti-anti-sigma factor